MQQTRGFRFSSFLGCNFKLWLFSDGHHSQGEQQYNPNDYYLKQQAARMLSAIQKGCKCFNAFFKVTILIGKRLPVFHQKFLSTF